MNRVIAMEWRDTLFLHWPVEPEALRPLVPHDVELDTYDGTAWIGIVAFRMAGVRLRGLPAALALPAFGEVNVRTYVTGPGKAGVFFFSLDAANAIAVGAGRRVHLPYYHARVDVSCDASHASYRCERTDAHSGPASFAADARFGGDVRLGAPGSLDRWLVERYCLYTVDPNGRLLRGDVEHAPWLLRDATATIEVNSVLDAAGVVPCMSEPLVHVSPGVTVRAWPFRPVTSVLCEN